MSGNQVRSGKDWSLRAQASNGRPERRPAGLIEIDWEHDDRDGDGTAGGQKKKQERAEKIGDQNWGHPEIQSCCSVLQTRGVGVFVVSRQSEGRAGGKTTGRLVLLVLFQWSCTVARSLESPKATDLRTSYC